MPQGPIILTGFMCSGKTTVAIALGKHLSGTAIDLDDVITKEGRSATQVIEQDGEERFRELETRKLAEVLIDPSARVVALGGGAWILERNRELIKNAQGITVWLDAPFDLCWERMCDGSERPLARDRVFAGALYDQRKPFYALADIRIELTRDKRIDQIVEEILTAMSHRT